MIEKVILSIAEYFRVFQIICSIFIALAVSFTIERFFVVRRQWYWKLLLFGCSWLLSSMPFFIGDLVNLPPTVLIFVAGILLGCEGSLLKKLSLSFMIISLTSSFSVLIDNYLLLADSEIPTEQERIVYLSVKLLFT